MKITSIQSHQQKQTFKSHLTPTDLRYKQKLISGILEKYQFTPKVESLKSILAPNELKSLLKKFNAKHFSIGRSDAEFENVRSGNYRVNLHSHTKYSDGTMLPSEFLAQSKSYADRVAKIGHNDGLPPYTTATTDHNNFEANVEIIARIAEEPEKYKNLKFVAGCEFMFLDKSSGFAAPAYEVLGLAINPFDKDLAHNVSALNSPNLIPAIKKDGAILSYAHPFRRLQGNGINQEFIEYLKKIGVDGIESNYQYVNLKPTKELEDAIAAIKKVALDNNFYETGGNDTHAKNIFYAGCDKYLEVLA